jgi:exodeoxyribonuclease VII large subunit
VNSEYITISEINKYIKNVIDKDEFLSKIYIKGEISNLKFHTSGHLYFSLKDEKSKINAVMFSFSNSKLLFTPKDGMNVLIKGRISVYESSGSYQVYVEEMLEDGVGNLYILFEELKQKLSKEGLFDAIHKKSIPKIPSTVGVITASTGAAVKDIISTINKRFPMTNIILFPTLVQGEGAKENIVAMIKKANELNNVDVIILGRGGGSIEDLWAFNEEIVARAIFNSNIPIISAVGHEIDFTISDFVADLRAPTPTGAAMLAVPDKNEIMRYIFDARNRAYKAMINKIENNNEKLERFKTSYILKNPYALFEVKQQNLDRLYEKISMIIKNIVNKNEYIFENYKLKLDLLNPSIILSKGYSIIKKDDKIIKSKKNIVESDNLNIIMSDGEINIKVSEVI